MEVIVLGAGLTGMFTALDLAMRGASVVLVEKGARSSGSSVSIGGVIHSGARFAAINPVLAKTCKKESETWRAMAGDFINADGGYFIRVPETDSKYVEDWLAGLDSANIPHASLSVNEVPSQKLKRQSVIEAFETPEQVIQLGAFMKALLNEAVEKGVLYVNAAEWMAVGKEDGYYEVNLKRGWFETKIKGFIVNATGAQIPEVTRAIGGIPRGKFAKFRGSHLVFREKLGGVIEKIGKPGQADLFSPALSEGLSLAAPTLTPWDGDEMSQEEYLTLLRGTKEVFDISDPDVLGYLSTARLSYDQASSEMPTDYLEEIGGLVNAYSSNFTCARLVAEKAADILATKLGIQKASSTAKIQISSEEFSFKPLNHSARERTIPR